MATPDIRREFVALDSPSGFRNPAGYHPCQGVWHTPAGREPKTAFVATHYNVDFSEHYLAELMAERGFGFLGWNTRYRGYEYIFSLDHALVDIGTGVRWLRDEKGVETVVLLGNSGGGSLMAAYQSQAGEPNLTALPGMPLTPAVQDLEPGDLYVSLQAHGGRPEVMTAWMDPSVTDESDPFSVDGSLDMYDPANGPPYSPEFVRSYRAAQEARNHRITDWVWAELERSRAHEAFDRAFTLHRIWADLRLLDPDLEPSDRPIGVCYLGNARWANYSPYTIGASCTLRTWLSMWSLRDSQCQAAPHLARIRAPALVVQSTADTGVFPSDARAIHDGLASTDKELHLIAGDHYLVAPAGARETTADLIAGWTESREA